MKRILVSNTVLTLLAFAALSACQTGTPQTTNSPVQAPPASTAAIDLASATLQPAQATSPSSTEDSSKGVPAPGLTGVYVYQIQTDGSQARFSLDEVLRGKPNRVVGSTNQVSGEIRLDFDGRQAQVGTIQVTSSALKTDSGMRDRMINNFILETGQYASITFKPTGISGLPEQADIGEVVTFQVTGDLTIRDVTKSVTFDVTAKLVSKDRLEGSATATVLRSDFGLTIPSVPSVADVSDDVLLELEFVALAS
jgi:polyisoprenoid-binding protein YceI